MTRDEQFEVIEENVPKVYEAGKKAEYDRFWDLYQTKGVPGMHHGAFAGSRWNDDTFYPKYDIHMRYGSSYAFFFNQVTDIVARLKECGVKLSTKEANNLNNAFNSIKSTTLPTIDVTGEPTKTSSLFAGSTLLKTIEKIVVNKKATYSYWFSQCYALENVVFEGEIGNNLDMQACTLLSKESIESVITHLSDTATGKTLSLSKAAVEKAFENNRTEIPIGLTTTQEGANVTATDNGDGTITLNGTIDTDTFFEVGHPTDTFLAGAYTLSIPHNDYGTFYVTLYDLEGQYLAMYDEWSNGEEITFTASKDFTMTAQLYVMGSAEFNAVIITKPTIYQDWDSLAATKPNWTISLV